MMKSKLVFLENGDGYGARFAAYVERHELLEGGIHRIRAGRDLSELFGTEGTAVLLAEEEAWERLPESQQEELKQKTERILFLGETAGREKENRFCRYQPMPELLRRIRELSGGRISPRAVPKVGTEVYVVYAPAGSGKLSACSAALGQLLAERGRTLLLTLEAFPGFSQNGDEQGLSELLYRMRAGDFPESPEPYTMQSGPLDLLIPAVSPRDLWELSAEEEGELLWKLQEQDVYEYLVAAAGPGKDPNPLIKNCRHLIILHEDTPDGRARKDRFLHDLFETAEQLPEEIGELALPPLAAPEDFSGFGPELRYTVPGSRLRVLLEQEKTIAQAEKIGYTEY